MVRLQTRMMAVLRGLVFACLRVNVSMSRTPVLQRVSVAAQRLAMSLCIEWSCEVSCWGVGARMGLVTSTPCMSSPCGCVGTLSDCRVTAVWLGGYAEWSYDGECTNASARECSNSCKMESARSRRRREMGDVAVCLRRGLNRTRASSTVGGVVWRLLREGAIRWRRSSSCTSRRRWVARRQCSCIYRAVWATVMEWWVYPGEDELREWRCCGLGGDGVRRWCAALATSTCSFVT